MTFAVPAPRIPSIEIRNSEFSRIHEEYIEQIHQTKEALALIERGLASGDIILLPSDFKIYDRFFYQMYAVTKNFYAEIATLSSEPYSKRFKHLVSLAENELGSYAKCREMVVRWIFSNNQNKKISSISKLR